MLFLMLVGALALAVLSENGTLAAILIGLLIWRYVPMAATFCSSALGLDEDYDDRSTAKRNGAA